MSFARWAEEGSEVYIFFDVSYGCVVCFGCLLQDENDESVFCIHSLQDFMQHMQDHCDKGHKIPYGLENDFGVHFSV